jgi:acyl-CoA thioesterase FadM
MQFLASLGFSEMDLAGTGIIMADVGIEFKSELFYGDTVTAAVAVANPGKVSFDIYYRLEKEKDGKKIIVALAKTGMVCYDYANKRIVNLPEAARLKFQSMAEIK